MTTPVVANLGCGPIGSSSFPKSFNGWRELRVDLDPSVKPDILGDLTDLSGIANQSMDAIWASHCLEHLYLHQVPKALSEFYRILKPNGFACILVPDIQGIAQLIENDRFHEVLYQSAAGPITPHDMMYGHSQAIESGRPSMAHRCGFTPTLMLQCFQKTHFADVSLRRRTGTLELIAFAQKSIARTPEAIQEFIEGLGQ